MPRKKTATKTSKPSTKKKSISKRSSNKAAELPTAQASTTQSTAQQTSAHDQTVDQVLVALQKTFSRLSRDSANVPPGQARALITGSVAFDITVACTLGPDETLRLDSVNGSPLRLSGNIQTDLDITAAPAPGSGIGTDTDD